MKNRSKNRWKDQSVIFSMNWTAEGPPHGLLAPKSSQNPPKLTSKLVQNKCKIDQIHPETHPWPPAARSLPADATETAQAGRSSRRPAYRHSGCVRAHAQAPAARDCRLRRALHRFRRNPQISGPATGAGGSDPRLKRARSLSMASKQAFCSFIYPQ